MEQRREKDPDHGTNRGRQGFYRQRRTESTTLFQPHVYLEEFRPTIVFHLLAGIRSVESEANVLRAKKRTGYQSFRRRLYP